MGLVLLVLGNAEASSGDHYFAYCLSGVPLYHK